MAMAKKVKQWDDELMEPSKAAKKFWGKTVEDKLPKPDVKEFLEKNLVTSKLLVEIMTFARGAESRGEFLFRQNYLKPFFIAAKEAYGNVVYEDAMGNFIVTVGEDSQVMHVGHMDSVHDDDHSPYQVIEIDEENVAHLQEHRKHSFPKIVEGTRWYHGVDVKYHYTSYETPKPLGACLGADDGCAIATMLFMIMHQIPGAYVFTRGEEIGCVGIKYMLEEIPQFFQQYKMAIEVDRKGTNEIINSMAPGMTASGSFVTALADKLDMGHKASKGTYTDVAWIAKYVPECVNIAAGYNMQHSRRETTDLTYIDTLADAMINVEWDSLLEHCSRAPNDYSKPYTAPKGGTRGYQGRGGLYDDLGGYANSGNQGWSSTINEFGDYAPSPSLDTTPVSESWDKKSEFQKEGWVRKNVGLITELLLALDMSPADMANVANFVEEEAEVIDTSADNKE